ncbi:MAG: 2-O-(6-phospho-alpha-D-mannosyl)-D-glycerate hydrolase [Chloroflexota bacterium]|nr:2-O-(6-phospho-alpha-D-mannosyl)-D-glycerate hydrolase [Chloroflexota bacterium]
MTERTVVHLVPHTHWDREWYEPFQTFRMRLVELVDQLLDRMERDPRLRFTLDGQAATVDDYLEVRPDAEPLIRRLIAERRLAIGPWQILMDEFLVSGETIIRNLEFGWARAEALGRAMPVGYLPDMFGHIAQMPQILQRAGISRAVVWRGVPEAIDRDTFRWSAPDGSEVIAEYLVGGYGNGAYLFDVPDLLASKLVGYRAANAGFYGDRSLLAMYGTDHAVPSPRLADLVEAVNRSDNGIEVRLETLADYAARAEVDDRPPSAWTGELRSGARANMLMGVSSARIDLKAACGRVERLLERYAEPLTALHGGPWPERLLELAWRRIVDNSAHDSVVAQVLSRFAEAEQIGRGILNDTARRIASDIPLGSWGIINPSPSARTDLVAVDVSVTAGEEAAFSVGGQRVVTQELSRRDPVIARIRVRGEQIPELLRRRRHGRELFGRQLNGSGVDLDGELPTITLLVDDIGEPPELDVDALIESVGVAASGAPEALWELVVLAADRRQLLLRVDAPPLGWSTVEASSAESVADVDPGSVVVTPRSLANGLVRLTVDDDGTARLEGNGAELAGVGRLVDGGEFGDSYNYGPPTEDRLVDAPLSVAIEASAHGPLLGELLVRRRYDWPLAVEPSGAARSQVTTETEVTTRYEVRIGEPFVRVRIEFENRSRDHRLRWHIPLPDAATTSAAEGGFAVVERGLTMEGGHGEVPLPTYPARGFVHVAGLSVLLDQLTEYELVDGGRELAVTVLRAFALISRNANPYREDPAGPEIPIPDAQRIGACSLGFAVMPHAGGWSEAGVLEAAERYQLPLLAVRGTARSEIAGPGHRPGLSLEGPGVVLSALRRWGDWLELRLVAEHATATTAIVRGDFVEAKTVDLLGRVGASLPMTGSVLRLPLGPWEIATVRLRMKGPS